MDTKALRQKILDLAIRGKLVPQDPNDEPASVLLEKIRAEKQQMVKDGRLKAKDIKNDTIIFKGEDNLHYEKFQDGSVKCIENEIPFEVPEGWAWARLGTMTNIVTGRLDANAQTPDGEYPFFTCGEEVFKTDSYAFDCNAILLGGNNATGDFKMHKFSGKFNAYQRVYVITTFSEIDMEYLYNHIRYYLPKLQSQSIGSQTRYLKLGMITDLLIAVPTLNEQNQISLLCNKYLNYCTDIFTEKEELLNIVKLTKSKILDLAIRGLLVPQDPNDEPASVLLERIRAEKEELIKQGKIKRDKKESIIFRGEDNSYYEKIGNKSDNIDENIPFEIPVTWNWCRGYTCFAGMESKKPTDKFFDYIDIDSIDNHNHKIKKTKHLPASDAPSRASRAVQTGSVLFSLVRPYLENIALIEEKSANSIASTGFYVCNSAGVLYSEYMFFLMISGYVVSGLNQFMKGDNSPSISKDNIESWLYPIPPYEEQKVICKKIKSIFSKIEAIEKSLS